MRRYSKLFYIYIVECSDSSYYTGVTNNVDGRVWEHNNDTNETAYTFSRRPVILRYSEYFEYVNDAIAREKQIKGWSRKKKEALINGKENQLRQLSRGRKGYMNRKMFK